MNRKAVSRLTEKDLPPQNHFLPGRITVLERI
jgi:hypothetical protein